MSSPANLSNIEMKVFSAQPIYDLETGELLYYGEMKIILVLANTNYSGVATLCSVDVGTD